MFDHEDGSCPQCGKGHAVVRQNRTSLQLFYGCSNFPACRNTEPLRRGGGSFLVSQDDMDFSYYDAEYDGDGKW